LFIVRPAKKRTNKRVYSLIENNEVSDNATINPVASHSSSFGSLLNIFKEPSCFAPLRLCEKKELQA